MPSRVIAASVSMLRTEHGQDKIGADQPPDGAEGRDCPRADRAGWLPGAVAAAGPASAGPVNDKLRIDGSSGGTEDRWRR